MKRMFAAVGITALLAVRGWAAGLEMVYPNGGESLVPGDTITIKWKTGGIAENVTLILMQNKTYLAHIFGNIPNTGSKKWQVGKCVGMTLTSGSGYVIKVRTVSGSIHDDMDGPFSLSTPLTPVPPAPLPTMILMPNIIKAIIFPKPLNAKVKLQNFAFTMEGPGKIGYLEASLLVQSDRDFQIGEYGHPDYGAQWVMCRIENPIWQEGVQGSVISYGTYSVRGGADSVKLLAYPTWVLSKGVCTYALRFKPQYPGQLTGLRTFQKMPQQPFQPGSLCIRDFYPKISMYAVVYTELAGGNWTNVTDSLTFYLQYPPLPDWVPLTAVSIPDETNLCSSGMQKW